MTDPILAEPAARRTVADLHAGEVFSVPDTDLGPALIDAISMPMEGIRTIQVIDLYDGVADPTTHMLGLHRAVVVHEVVAEHHWYTNVSREVLAIEGERWRGVQRAEPGAEIHYTGVERPDLFDPAHWEHTVTPVVVEQEERPL